jgi:hypothetical protein
LENSVAADTDDAPQEEADGQSDNDKTTNDQTLGESSKHGEDASQFEARRQALLAAIASGGVEVGGPNEDGPVAATEPRVEKGQRASDAQNTLDWRKSEGVQQASADATAKSKTRPQAEAPLGNRRPKIDLPSSRRLLLGALGLPSPKKAKIATGAHSNGAAGRAATPLGPKRIVFDADGLNPVPVALAEQHDDEAPAADAADANWEGKIALAAEECCKDGVTLSAPPFPFAQRWDSQQKLPSYKQKKGEQKRKRYQPEDYEDDEHYHDDGAFEDAYEDADPEAGTSVPEHAAPTSKEPGGNTDEPAAPPPETEDMDDDDDDIPAVPSNLSDCPPVNFADLQVGAIIAFKRLVMTSNWQPELSEHQTGRVESILDGDMLEVELAKRYRQRREKKYDEEGRRVYDKFEAPDDEEFDEGREDVLTLSFSDLVEPRLVQAPTENSQQEGS